jgi:hypothetical protein
MTDAITVIMDRSCCIKSVSFERQPGYRSMSSYQWATAEAIDQEPGNERCQEEPGVKEASHQTRSVCVKAKTVLEQCAGVICHVVRIVYAQERIIHQLTDQSVDTTKLLEDLNAASNKETSAGVNHCARIVSSRVNYRSSLPQLTIRLQQILPAGCTSRSL